MGRQHSVSAKTNYPRLDRSKRISVQYDTHVKQNIYAQPQVESSFKDSSSTPNNYVIRSNQKTQNETRYEVLSSNYANKTESLLNRQQPFKTSEKRIYIERTSEVKPVQYMSERTKANTESKLITNRKTSYNDTNSYSKRGVVKTPSESSNANLNSLPWTETHTNSFQPVETKVIVNSLYPPQERSSSGLVQTNKYHSNDEYNFSYSQAKRPNMEYSTQIPKESIVLSRQRNPNVEMRSSEMKTSSFDSTPVKSKSI